MKKIICLITVCLCSLQLSAQSWQELYNQTEDCWGKDWPACQSILEEALKVAEQSFGKMDSAYILTLNDLGICYMEMGDYDKSLPILEQSLDLYATAMGKTHPDYGAGLNNLAMLLQDMGKYEEALPLFLETVKHAEVYLGKQHPSYNLRLNNLAVLYQDMGKYDRSLPLLEEALKLTELSLGKSHPRYAIRLNNVGLLYQSMGWYEKALPFMEEALVRTEASLGKSHPSYAIRLNNLGMLHESMSNYELALPLFQDALSITQELLGENHYVVGFRLNNLGLLYMSMGNYEKALELLQKALENTEQAFGRQHDQYGKTSNSLGLIYQNMGIYDKALPLLETSLQNCEDNFDKAHHFCITRLSNLGVLYKEMKNYERAMPMLREAMRMSEASLGKTHPSYIKRLGNLGGLLIEMGEYEQALPLLEESLQLTKQILGEEHQSYSYKLSNLAGLYMAMGQRSKASPLFRDLSEALSRQLQSHFATLDDRNQAIFLQTKQLQFDHLSSFLFERRKDTAIQDLGYDLQLMIKGFLQTNRSNLLLTLRNHPDSLVQTQYREWEALHHILARQFQYPISERIPSFDSLRNRADQIELSLAQRSTLFQKARKQVRWEEILSQLEPGQMAIEFAHFPLYYVGRKSDSMMYVAYVLRHGDTHPQMIPLCEEKALKQLFAGQSQEERSDHLYHGRGIKPKKNIIKVDNLYDLIWKPLAPICAGSHTIYYAPSGLLHRLNLNMIPIDKNRTLSDQFTLIRLESTRRLVLEKTQTRPTVRSTAFLMGGIDYDQEQKDIEQRSWAFLEATVTEVQHINELLTEQGIEVEVKTGELATEESLLKLDASPHILHIATHGYFFPDPKASPQAPDIKDAVAVQLSDHPMIRSGLILAGANHAWTGNPVPEGQEDGILTAYEISRMDLSNTELVVLSACETGLGEIQGNEGVYGLQRAFKIAGAKYVMMSLWQVPDKATQELMTTFYENWLDGMEIRKALHAAQKQMRKTYKEPYYWAGFVLVE